MTTFILIHGGMHGGWCWDEVVPLLTADGHVAVAPDLPGMGANRTPLWHVTLAKSADHIVDLVRAQLEPVVLAGHSLGGIVLSEVAERMPDRIAGLIYIAAALLANGVSLMDGPERDIARPGLIRSADGISVAYDPAYAAETFYNMTSPAKAKWAISRLTPQPVAPMLAPLMLSEARFGRVKRAYVECMEDNTLPIAMQRQMRDALPCDPVITLNADHSPFLSAPHELAAALIAIAYSFTAQ